MADKTIGQLTPASQVTPTDLFVLEQSGTAKKLTGQILENWLVSFADGHGGIQTIEKTGTSGLTDTYTITLADTTTMTFTVTNGKGIQSIATYWAVSSNGTTPPTNWSLTRQSMTATNRYLWSHQTITYNDGSIVNTTSSVVGVYGDKGDTGDTGVGISTLAQTARTPGVSTTYTFTMTDGSTKSFISYDGVGIAGISYTSSSGLVDTYTVTMTDGSTDTFTVTNAKSIVNIEWASNSGGGTRGDAGTYDTYIITYNDGDTSSFVVYNGANGTGSVASVDGIPSSGQNVPLLTIGNGPPTAETAGNVKSRYFDATSSILYICTAVNTSATPSTFTWKGTGVTVDSSLSSTSTNPVRNSAIYNKFGQVETSIAAKLPLAGGTMNGNIVMANKKITSLGDPTANGDAVTKRYVDGVCSRPNLLDNWYFVGGGSQGSTGIFPINQRGQSTYSGAGYCIDRWKIANTPVSATLNSDALTVSKTSALTSGYFAIRQDFGSLPAGTYTASALIKSASGVFRITAGSSGTSANRISSDDFSSAGLVTVTGTLSAMSDATFAFAGRDGSNSDFQIIACKLELGSSQTLAHNEGTEENPNWVLNELPDYYAELSKAQHYFMRFNLVNTGFLGLAIAQNANYCILPIPLPNMAKSPTVSLTSGALLAGSISIASIAYYSRTATDVMVRLNNTGAFTASQTYPVTASGATIVDISAET